MIIVMRHDATPAQVENLVAQVQIRGFRAHLSGGDERTVIGDGSSLSITVAPTM